MSEAKLSLRQRLARWLFGGPERTQVRMYAGARPTRGTVGFGSYGNTSADSELVSSLTMLRSRSRQMVRDNPYARRAKTLIVNNVIGAGIGIQAQARTLDGSLLERVNDEIEEAWDEWCQAENCHTAGTLHFGDLERVAMGEIFEAGEVLVRKHYAKFGSSRIPVALELIEAERLASEFDSVAGVAPAPGNEVRMGVEVDRFMRPVAYYIRERHPGDWRFNPQTVDRLERVPAADIFHLRMIDRPTQTRGVPWLHTVLVKLDAMNEYSAAEVQAARDSAFYFATVKSVSNPDGPPALSDQGAGTSAGDSAAPPTYNIESGVIQHLEPGEELNFHTPNRPNTAIDAFLRYMLREVAAGVGTSYASISQDYSQTNYSSSRLSLLDDRDCWRALQQWWLRSFRAPLHRFWLQQGVLARVVPSLPIDRYVSDMRRFEAVRFKLRGWSWVDPTKEVAAYKEAVKAGFTTVTDVIAATGGGNDIEDVIATRERELKMLEEAGIAVDTTVSEASATTEPMEPPPNDDDEGGEPTPQGGTQQDRTARPARVVSFGRN